MAFGEDAKGIGPSGSQRKTDGLALRGGAAGPGRGPGFSQNGRSQPPPAPGAATVHCTHHSGQGSSLRPRRGRRSRARARGKGATDSQGHGGVSAAAPGGHAQEARGLTLTCAQGPSVA